MTTTYYKATGLFATNNPLQLWGQIWDA